MQSKALKTADLWIFRGIRKTPPVLVFQKSDSLCEYFVFVFLDFLKPA